MKEVKEIAFAFPRGAHQEVFIQGILRFARENHRDWTYLTALESLQMSILDLVDWPGDGVLAALNTPEEVQAARSISIPVVNVSSALETPDIPTSVVDNQAIGRLAAEHLLSKGFRSFAYYGLSSVCYSSDRQAGFEEKIAAAEGEVHCFFAEATFGLKGSQWSKQQSVLAEWLSSLPTPCGLMAVTDYRARQALDACRSIGLRVPEQIALVGVDNEMVVCEHSPPPLSSVARNDELEGYRAASLLDGLIRGEVSDIAPPPISPTVVVQRQSTASHAVADSRLRVALDYIEQNLGDPITIDEMTEHAGVSRRWLEYAFREAFSESPYQYLRRKRLAQARLMLTGDPSLKVSEVARTTGFTSAKQLATTFQQEFGVSPTEWRKAARR